MILPHPGVAVTEQSGRMDPSWYRVLSSALTFVKAPTAATDNGIQGQVAYDSTHFYVCIAKNTWVRTTLATW